ncbi:Uncharacterized protein predicted to be involved in C-type cytochrome biogenesis [Serratia plymuthica]|nr:Uncharacterized protein predicted to be involved in C-type cytochrome biogenesis [Serratia plymuthica]
MLNIIRSALACLLMLWLPALQAADSGWLQSPANDHAKVRLRADTSHPGETRLLLAIELQKGWKTYWRSPGEGGIAPAISWQGKPPPATWFWPTPQRFDVAGISTQGYHDRVELPIVIKGAAPPQLAGTLTLSTCSNVCILTDYPFSLDLGTSPDAQFDHDFAQAMGLVPIAVGLVDGIKAGYQRGELQISAERTAGWRQPELFFDTLEDADLGKPQVSADGNLMLARVPVSDGWGDTAPDLCGKTLTLVISDGGIAQQVQLPIGGPLASPAAAAFPLWQAVLMALAGGLILNLMPCVLPVLGIKLGSILQVELRIGAASGCSFGFVIGHRRIFYGVGVADDGAAAEQSGAWLGHSVSKPVVYRLYGAGNAVVQRQPVRPVPRAAFLFAEYQTGDP